MTSWMPLKQFAAAVGALALLIVGARGTYAAHSASVSVSTDPTFPAYSGISNPAGLSQVNPGGLSPGFLNNISGGTDGGASGSANIKLPPINTLQLVAVSIHVTDQAGPSHSLSSLDDPALTDIVADLNNPAPLFITPYAFSSAPSQYQNAITALSGGEAAVGGQPFDLLFALDYPPDQPFGTGALEWGFGFSNEISNLDGITALSVTDVGAIATPEPGTVSVLALALGGIALRRRR